MALLLTIFTLSYLVYSIIVIRNARRTKSTISIIWISIKLFFWWSLLATPAMLLVMASK